MKRLGVTLLPKLCTQQKLRGTEWRSSPAKLSRNEKLTRYGRRWLRWFLVDTCFHTAVIRVEHHVFMQLRPLMDVFK